MKHAVREIVSAGMRLIQPFALAWLSPTPARAIPKMPYGRPAGTYGGLIAVDQVSGIWEV
jgi:hypothetical protein